MIDGLKRLNEAPWEEAEAALLSCCGSRRWASGMTEARPFAHLSALLERSEEIWRNLAPEDWLEAFAAHPKIGAKKAVQHQSAQSAEWSKGEQSGTSSATDSERTELEKLNRLYEKKFGFIFIICATGKSTGEMLEICRQRLDNNDDAELATAAGEQQKITEIRLKKLLEAGI